MSSHDYNGYITYCFSDWAAEGFKQAPMLIKEKKRTDVPVRGSLDELVEDTEYYIKPDPDFDNHTYRRCHQKLRETIQPGDYLFFRTNYHGRQYIIGYFRIKDKRDGEHGPVLVADPEESLLIDFRFELDKDNWGLVEKLNPNAVGRFDPGKSISRNMMFLGRNYLRLDKERTDLLLNEIERCR